MSKTERAFKLVMGFSTHSHLEFAALVSHCNNKICKNLYQGVVEGVKILNFCKWLILLDNNLVRYK